MEELDAVQKQSQTPTEKLNRKKRAAERPDQENALRPDDMEEQSATLAKLQESARLNMILLDSIPHPAMLVRRDATILAANYIAKQMGARIGEKCWWEFSSSEIKAPSPLPANPKATPLVQAIYDPEPTKPHCAEPWAFPGEIIRRPDCTAFGRIWDIRWIAVDEDKYLHYAVDTTEFRMAEEKIRTGAARFRELFNHFTSGGIILEPVSSGKAFIITDFNRRAEKICRVSKIEAIGKNVCSFLPQLETLSGIHLLERVWRTGGSESLTVKHQAEDGHDQWLDFSVFKLPSGELVVIFDDVTDRRHAEAALKKSEAYYRAVVEDQTELISRFKPDGTLTFVNQAYCRYFGESHEDLIGNRFWHHLPREDRKRLRRHIAKLCKNNPVATIQHEIVTAGGERKYLQWTDRAILDEDGNIIEYQAVGLDITKRRKAEQSARAQTRRVDTLNRIILWANKSQDLPTLLEGFLDSSLGLMDFDMGAIYLVEPRGQTAEVKCARGLPAAFLDRCSTLQIVESPHDRVFVKQKALVGNDLKSNFGPWRHRLEETGCNSAAIVPLLADDRVIGSLFIARCTRHTFTREEKRMLQSMGREMGNAIRKMQTEEALRESEKNSRFLSSQLLAAQERERHRISKELHDELGQSLLILKLQLKQIERKLPQDAPDLKQPCGNMLRYIDQIIDNVRRLSRDLRPAILEDLGLSAAIRRLIKDFCDHNEIQCQYDMIDVDAPFTPDEQISIYRILQESLTNVAKYAEARQVTISITQGEKGFLFVIEDDGKGFNVSETLAAKAGDRGLGFAAMDERARMLTGRLEIESSEGKGTRIRLFVPHRRGRDT